MGTHDMHGNWRDILACAADAYLEASVWLVRDDPRSRFVFCSEMIRRPKPGFDQI